MVSEIESYQLKPASDRGEWFKNFESALQNAAATAFLHKINIELWRSVGLDKDEIKAVFRRAHTSGAFNREIEAAKQDGKIPTLLAIIDKRSNRVVYSTPYCTNTEKATIKAFNRL